jgi:hypothetical protein
MPIQTVYRLHTGTCAKHCHRIISMKTFIVYVLVRSLQPIYYQQSSTNGTQNLNTILSSSTSTSLNASLQSNVNQPATLTNVPSYYELTYATTPTVETTSPYVYTTASGQTFSYASLPTGPTANGNPMNEIYCNHTTKYIIDESDRHQRTTTAGW